MWYKSLLPHTLLKFPQSTGWCCWQNLLSPHAHWRTYQNLHFAVAFEAIVGIILLVQLPSDLNDNLDFDYLELRRTFSAVMFLERCPLVQLSCLQRWSINISRTAIQWLVLSIRYVRPKAGFSLVWSPSFQSANRHQAMPANGLSSQL